MTRLHSNLKLSTASGSLTDLNSTDVISPHVYYFVSTAIFNNNLYHHVPNRAIVPPCISFVHVLIYTMAQGKLRSLFVSLSPRWYSTRQESKIWRQKPNRKAKLSIILTEDVPTLGFKGQVVKVNHGYGRNYLLPQRKAVYATPVNIATHNAWKAEKGRLSLASEQQLLTNFLAGKVLVIGQEKDTKWIMYPQHISMALRHQFQLHAPLDSIQLDKPLTSFGNYKVGVKVDDSTTLTMEVEVVPKETRGASKSVQAPAV